MVYETYISRVSTHLIVEGVKTLMATGMTVTAEIKVDKRRIIKFFIYPLTKYLGEEINVR